MQEFRCEKCRRLLAKVDCDGIVEVKCTRCKSLNSYKKMGEIITINAIHIEKESFPKKSFTFEKSVL